MPRHECATGDRPVKRSFAVDGFRIELAIRVHERQSCTALAFFDLSVKAGVSSGVAGGTGLLDPDPYRVLIAIQPHLDDTLDVTGGLALAPQGFARAAVIPGFSARDRLAQSLFIHMRDHQYLAASGVGRDTGDKTRGVESGLKLEPFLDLVVIG